MVDGTGTEFDPLEVAMERLEQAGNKRLLDREEIRDACSASSQLLPQGMFAKAVKVLIWQGQLLRGLAQSAVQTELRSVLEMAWEQKQTQNKRCRCNPPVESGAEEGCNAANPDKPEQAALFEESKRNFDLDSFLAPSCRTCGWPIEACSCVWEEEADSVASRVFPVKEGGKIEGDGSRAETKRETGKEAEEEDGDQSEEPSKPKAPPTPRGEAACEPEMKRGGGEEEEVKTMASRKPLPPREPSARQRARRAAGSSQ